MTQIDFNKVGKLVFKAEKGDEGVYWLHYRICGYWVDAMFLGMVIGLSAVLIPIGIAYLTGGFCHGT